jgi:hypothetical protein
MENDNDNSEENTRKRRLEQLENEGDLLANALSSLPDLLNKRQKELEEKENALDEKQRALQRAVQDFENEKALAFGNTKTTDVLHLNLGGTKMVVSRQALTLVPGSVLASQFSGRWDDRIAKDRDGNYFMDQPIELFEPMVNYLRAKLCKLPGSKPTPCPEFTDDRKKTQLFYQMVDFYGMTFGIFPSKLKVYHGKESDVKIIDDRTATANEWTTFYIERYGHERHIKSFEVTVERAESLKVGWMMSLSNRWLPSDNKSGVGDVEGSIGLHFPPYCGINLDGIIDHPITMLNAMPLKEGTVIRCEDFGNKWYVNGRQVGYTGQYNPDNGGFAHLDQRNSNMNVFRFIDSPQQRSTVPAISVKGKIRISDIVYEASNDSRYTD